MAKAKDFHLHLEVEFHNRCKANRHKTKRTKVFIHTKLVGNNQECIEEHNWEVLCRMTLEGLITWAFSETNIPDLIVNEVVSMYTNEEITEIFNNLPVRKKF